MWVKKDRLEFNKFEDLRLTVAPLNKHEDFKTYIYNNTPDALKYFNKDKYQWDFAVVRQGFYDYSKKIFNPKDLNPRIQYLFIKYLSPESRKILDRIDFAKLSETNTAIRDFRILI